MPIDAVFMKGGNLRRLCEATLADGSVAVVEPYAIYTSPKKRRTLLWYEVSKGGSEAGAGWKHPEAASVTAMKLLETPYTPRKDYNPFDTVKFPVVHYSVPTHDGRQRWLEGGRNPDKQTLRT